MGAALHGNQTRHYGGVMSIASGPSSSGSSGSFSRSVGMISKGAGGRRGGWRARRLKKSSSSMCWTRFRRSSGNWDERGSQVNHGLAVCAASVRTHWGKPRPKGQAHHQNACKSKPVVCVAAEIGWGIVRAHKHSVRSSKPDMLLLRIAGKNGVISRCADLRPCVTDFANRVRGLCHQQQKGAPTCVPKSVFL